MSKKNFYKTRIVRLDLLSLKNPTKSFKITFGEQSIKIKPLLYNIRLKEFKTEK